MRAELFLAHKYIGGHKKQCAGIVFSVSLCVAAFMTSFLYRDCSFASFDYQNYEKYGSYSAILYDVNLQQEQKVREAVASSKSGIVCVTNQILTDQNNIPVYMGYMDPNAIDLKAIHMKEGRFPKTKGEVAVEQSTYTALGMTMSVGDEISLPVVQNDGVRNEKFKLVGILQDYVSKWKLLDSSKVSVKNQPPGILTVPDSMPVRYMHVLCNQCRFDNDLGGRYVENHQTVSENKADLPAKKAYTDVILFPLIAFFILVTVFSIYSIVRSTLSERRHFFEMLRCIGLKKSRGKRLLLLQAAELFIASSLAGTVLSILMSLGIVGISRFSDAPLVLSFRPASFGISYAVAAAAVFCTALFPLHSFFKKGPLETGLPGREKEKRNHVSTNKLTVLWEHANKSAYRSQNAVSVLFVALCVLMSVFGSFFAVFQPRLYHASIARGDFPKNEDYQVFANNGTSTPENFYITLPRRMGVSVDGLQTLQNCPGLKINYAMIDFMTSHYLLLKKGDPNPYLQALKNEPRVLQNTGPDAKRAVCLAGGGPGDLLVEPHVYGLDYASMRSLFGKLSAGSIDRAKYIAGEEILAPDNFCKVGDVFTLITPVLSGEVQEDNTKNRIRFSVNKIRVAATYPSDNPTGKLVLSGEFILKTDPSARYDFISMQNMKKGDPEASRKIDNILSGVVAKSENVVLRDLVKEKQQFLSSVQEKVVSNIVSAAIFMVIILLSFALSTYVKARTNMHSYLLMRAIGARTGIVRQLLLYDMRQQLIKGSLIGTVLSFVVAFAFTQKYSYLPSQDIFIYNMLPTAFVVFLILYLFSSLAIRRAVNLLTHRSIIEELSEVEF